MSKVVSPSTFRTTRHWICYADASQLISPRSIHADLNTDTIQFSLSEPAIWTFDYTVVCGVISECSQQTSSWICFRTDFSANLGSIISKIVRPWTWGRANSISCRNLSIINVKTFREASFCFIVIGIGILSWVKRAMLKAFLSQVFCERVRRAFSWYDASIVDIFRVSKDWSSGTVFNA